VRGSAMSARLDEKVAIVTGAGAGIGRAAARRFAAEGARVVAADRDAAAATETTSLITEGGGQARAQVVDVTGSAQVAALIEQTTEHFGGIDVFYANAGVGGVGSAAEIDEAEWHRVIGVN